VEYRAALITGASSGIGAAFAKVLPASTELLLSGTNEASLRRVAEPLATEARRVDCIAADLTTAAGREAVVKQACLHAIDLLICNAGIGQAGSFLETPLAVQRDTLAVNVLAAVDLLHALLPEMIARARRQHRRAGAIIVSSMAAFGAAPGLACYGATKAFELHLARSLAAELRGEPIDVLALCPTYTDTRFFARAGLSPPRRAMAAELVAGEAFRALGRRTVHVCSLRRRYPHAIRRLIAFNPALAAWRWPHHVAAPLFEAVRPHLRWR
jgi:short-subunit dehydrogenase